MNERRIVTQYAKMWPRRVFDLRDGKKLLTDLKELLNKPGVYILYHDEQPYQEVL